MCLCFGSLVSSWRTCAASASVFSFFARLHVDRSVSLEGSLQDPAVWRVPSSPQCRGLHLDAKILGMPAGRARVLEGHLSHEVTVLAKHARGLPESCCQVGPGHDDLVFSANVEVIHAGVHTGVRALRVVMQTGTSKSRWFTRFVVHAAQVVNIGSQPRGLAQRLFRPDLFFITSLTTV